MKTKRLHQMNQCSLRFYLFNRKKLFQCDPGEARTLDPMIKSHLLYQLSYGVKDHTIPLNDYGHKSSASIHFSKSRPTFFD